MSIALARRGHEVICIDRDPGGATPEEWKRVGVMQFRLPHFFRPAVRNALRAEMPEVYDALVEAGVGVTPMEGMQDEMTGIASRRSTFEYVLRAAAEREPGVAIHVGHADRITVENGQATGVVVDGRRLDADIVISAAGRASHLGDELREAPIGGPTGFAYASRMYSTKRGAEPLSSPVPIGAMADGYLSIVFPQDNGTHCTLVVRPADDKGLAELRHEAAYEAAAASIPNLAPWTDPGRFEPITDVLAGAGLNNLYTMQGPEPGVPPALGLYFVGDAVCLTNPAAGRGVSLGFDQARELLRLLDDGGLDHSERSSAFEQWCDERVRPWFEDHVYWDETLLRRFAGRDLDLEAKIPSDVICSAAIEKLPHLMALAGPFMGMITLPASLDTAQEEVRDLLRTGWRPALSPGPTRDELVEAISPLVA